jgi:translation initiation factor 2-alpha kinase 4
LLNEKIKLDDSLNKERKQQLARQELEKNRQRSLATLDDGEMASREVNLDQAITVEGYQGSWTSWNLFGGKKEMLWTTYLAEPIVRDGSVDPNFVKTTLPTLWVQVIDFSQPHYSLEQGKKRIESLVTEIQRLQDVSSDHVLKVYAVKRTKSPKDWERLMIFVERPTEGGLLRSRLPKDGLDEETAIVSATCLGRSPLTAQDYYTQIMTGLSCLHKRNHTQKRKSWLPGLRSHSVFDSSYVVVSCPRAGETVVKLMGTAYAKRIIDLHKSNPFLKQYSEINSENW